METLIMHPENKEQLAALKAFAKALKVPFEKKKNAELTEREKAMELYGADFLEMIESRLESAKKGNVKPLDLTKSLWDNIQ